MARLPSARQERGYLATVMRAEGTTWVGIATDFRLRYTINARKALRWAHGWSQSEVARLWTAEWPKEPKTRQNISLWESWPESGHEPSLKTLGRLAQLYECDLADLLVDISNFRARDSAAATSDRPPVSSPVDVLHVEDSGDDVGTDRREFTKAAVALSTVGWTASTLAALPSRDVRVADAHVDAVRTAVQETVTLDSRNGAAAVYGHAVGIREEVAGWLDRGSFDNRRTEDVVRSMLGDLTTWVGWLALDAGWRRTARQWFSEAVLDARVLGDPIVEVRALSGICMLTRAKRPLESLNCARAAQDAAAGWSTPRLSGLLHARAAVAHASLGEESGCIREFAQARSLFSRGASEDDPAFIHFFTEEELAGLEGLALLALGKPRRAAAAFRTVTEGLEPGFRRNVGYYTVRLAEAAVQEADFAHACEIGCRAVPMVAELQSGRTAALLAAVRAKIQPLGKTLPIARDFAELYDTTLAR